MLRIACTCADWRCVTLIMGRINLCLFVRMLSAEDKLILSQTQQQSLQQIVFISGVLTARLNCTLQCSRTCGVGRRTRTHTCYMGRDPVNDVFCLLEEKPESIISCNQGACACTQNVLPVSKISVFLGHKKLKLKTKLSLFNLQRLRNKFITPCTNHSRWHRLSHLYDLCEV